MLLSVAPDTTCLQHPFVHLRSSSVRGISLYQSHFLMFMAIHPSSHILVIFGGSLISITSKPWLSCPSLEW